MKVLSEGISLTRLELVTIMEDAFIDGWKTRDSDWISPEDYLELHKQYGDKSETTVAIDQIKDGA